MLYHVESIQGNINLVRPCTKSLFCVKFLFCVKTCKYSVLQHFAALKNLLSFQEATYVFRPGRLPAYRQMFYMVSNSTVRVSATYSVIS